MVLMPQSLVIAFGLKISWISPAMDSLSGVIHHVDNDQYLSRIKFSTHLSEYQSLEGAKLQGCVGLTFPCHSWSLFHVHLFLQ
jgi:hypothetical protein